MTDCLLTEWQYPPMETGDVVWLYTSLEGEDYLEAVSVIVAKQAGKLAIRWLEWGQLQQVRNYGFKSDLRY